MKEIFKKIIAEFWDDERQYIKRKRIPSDLTLSKTPMIIIGPRRAGKSYTIYEIRDVFLANGSDKKDFLYVNFEDERLAGFEKKHFDVLLESYSEMNDKKPKIFLDEIQNIGGWDSFVRRLADQEYKVIVTGSNSKMLSKEIAEKLGGRFVEIKIFPLSFQEFLQIKGIKLEKISEYTKERFQLKKYFDEYFDYGGFPEVATLTQKESKEKVLLTYFDLVFYKDLIARKKILNEDALRFTIKKVRETIGSIVTPRSIYASLKKANIGVGPNTVELYLNYLEEAFLLIPCTPYAKSVSRSEQKKRYVVDNGYIKLLEVKEDKGLHLENLIFMELKKNESHIHHHQGKRECDFIVNKKTALQVTLEINESNEKREVEGLLEAIETYALEEGFIITFDQEGEIKKNGKVIKLVPAWKWCLFMTKEQVLFK